MTTKKTEQNDAQEEQPSGMDCCSPEMFTEMMAKCSEKMPCGSMMQEMMKGGCCQPKQK